MVEGRIVMHIQGQQTRYIVPINTPNGTRCFIIRTDTTPGKAFFSRPARYNGHFWTCRYACVVGEPCSAPEFILNDPMRIIGENDEMLSVTLKQHENQWKFRAIHEVGF